ncbi:MAG: YHS domain-containing protein [Dehalococcoidia bacterium]|nr:YHS domain-containing protein [Dehalococcoidia bacterium]
MTSRLLGLFRRPETAEDPVCHMQVNVKNPPGGTHEYSGQTYYFCGPGCRVAFSKEPNAYLSGEKRLKM